MTQTGVTAAITRRGFLGATVAAAGSAAVSGSQGSPRTRAADSWIPSDDRLASLAPLMRLAQVPGLAIAVIERDTIWSRVFGVTNADTGELVVTQTLFEAASISKPVFTYGVLQLVADGRLSLDAPLAGIFRPAHLPADDFIDRITARHVLTHTSGLPNWGSDNTPASMRPSFPPGMYFRYSGEGFFWLQLVVESITGQGLDAFMRQRLFTPGGMSRSMFTWDEAHLPDVSFGHQDGRVIVTHGMRPVMGLVGPRARLWNKPLRDWTHRDFLRAGAELQPNAPPVRVRFQNAAGSLLTTAVDYARFMTLMCDRLSRASWELPDPLRRLMVTPIAPVQDEGGLSWSFGWAIEQSRMRRYFVHEGNNDNVFTSCAIGDPVEGRGLVILTNAGSGAGLARRLVHELTGVSPQVFIAHLDPRRDG